MTAGPRLAIVSINHRPELTGIAVYTTGLSEFLAASGWTVDVYTGFPYYPQWKKAAEDRGLYRRERLGGVVVRRHYLYVPSKPSALRRMLHELSFVASVSLGYLLGPRADCTVIVSPPLALGVVIGLIARVRGSRILFHVQDLQPDAAIDFGLLKPGLLTRLMFGVESLCYRLCHLVSSISETMLARIRAKGVPEWKLRLLRNWADDDLVQPLDRTTALRTQWCLDDAKVVLYSGNLGVKQGLQGLLDAAALLRDQRDIAIVIVGDGGEKGKLIARVEREGLSNVRFAPLQPRERLSELLATCDIAIIPQLAGSSEVVYPSKLANLLAAGRPVVACTRRDSELARVVTKAVCGLVVEPGSAKDMATAIRQLASNPALRGDLGRNGRRYMQDNLARNAVLPGFVTALREIASDGQAVGATERR
jgi:colanic acid biosynthesis glycosyl transferase WcaI